MKSIIIALALTIMAGCSSFVSTEQLEAEALRTGDWSLVEKRERAIARREARNYSNCPAGKTAYCESYGIDNRCFCVETKSILSFADY